MNMNKVPTENQLQKLPRIPLRAQTCGPEDFIYLFPYDPSTSDYFLEYTFNEAKLVQTKFIMGDGMGEPAISGKHSRYVVFLLAASTVRGPTHIYIYIYICFLLLFGCLGGGGGSSAAGDPESVT